jgi:hypothetical protein
VSVGWLTPAFIKAWPHAETKFVPITQNDGRQFYLNALLPAPDRILGYIGGPPSDPSSQGLVNPIAVLLNPATGSMTEIVTLNPSKAQGGFDADETYVVWMEASDPRSIDWRLLSKRIGGSSDSPRVLASAKASDSTTGGSFVFPHVDHSVVVWSELSGPTSNVYAASADGTAPRLIARDAAAPQFTWPLVAYARHSAPSAPISQFVVAVYDLETRTESVLNDIESPSSWAISTSRIAWVDTARKKLFLRDLKTGQQTLIAASSASLTDYLQFPVMNSRYLAWSQEGAEWIYDTVTRKSIQLSQHRLFNSVWLHGDSLAWPVAIPREDPSWKPWSGLRGYYVVDTRTLT